MFVFELSRGYTNFVLPSTEDQARHERTNLAFSSFVSIFFAKGVRLTAPAKCSRYSSAFSSDARLDRMHRSPAAVCPYSRRLADLHQAKVVSQLPIRAECPFSCQRSNAQPFQLCPLPEVRPDWPDQ